MIWRILTFFILPCLVISFVLFFAGVNSSNFGSGYYTFLREVNETYSSWSLQIPNIPDIPLLQQEGELTPTKSVVRVVTTPVIGAGGNTVLGRLKGIINLLIIFCNFIIKFLNFIITVLNVAIQVLQFVLTAVWKFKDLPRIIREQSIYEVGQDIIPVYNYQDGSEWMQYISYV